LGALYLLGTFLTVWMAVDAVRRGRSFYWLWIMILFNPLGAVIYFFAEYLDGSPLARWTRQALPGVTAAELRRAEADVNRLDNAATWLAYATALRARGQHAKAIEAAQKAADRAPANVDAQYELARALVDAKRPAEAIAPLERVVGHSRSFDSEQALFLLGRAQCASGDLEAARRSLEEVGSRSSRPEFLYELATLQARLGDRESAARTLQRIVHESELVPPYLKGSVRPWVRKARGGLRKLGY
jgi:hypothetical protein